MESLLAALFPPPLCGSWCACLAETQAVLLQTFSGLQVDISSNKYFDYDQREISGAGVCMMYARYNYVYEERETIFTVIVM